MTAIQEQVQTRRDATMHPGTPDESVRLLVSCTDRCGVVARVSSFLAEHAANIVQSDQDLTGASGGRSFLLTVFHLSQMAEQLPAFDDAFAEEVARPIGARCYFRPVTTRDLRLAVRAPPSRLSLAGTAASSHWTSCRWCLTFGIPFAHIPVTAETKAVAEERQLDLLRARGVELIVLARYMQTLSGDFLVRAGAPVINIHHSFLPAFAGAGPYSQAKQRGVKLIGATAHYATEDLDDGPIIEQDVVRVTHRADVSEKARLGADIEPAVLACAVGWHATTASWWTGAQPSSLEARDIRRATE